MFRVMLCMVLSSMVGMGAVLAPAGASATENCSGNQAARTEQGTSLADCRAYEMVTPAMKDSGQPYAFEGPAGVQGAHAAQDGERMAWDAEYALPGSGAPGLDYLSVRGADGWTTENAIPRQSVENGLGCPYLVGYAAWSSDLSKGVLADGFGQGTPEESFLGEGLECGHDEPRLVSGEPEGFQNLFLHDNRNRTYELVNLTPAGTSAPAPKANSNERYFPASFLAASSDLTHVVFEEQLPLTPEAGAGDELYEWANGTVRLVSLRPDGTPVHGELAGAPVGQLDVGSFTHAVSTDGTRVFFTAEGKLYVRENADQPQSALGPSGECTEAERACTVQVDAPQGSGPGGSGVFLGSSANGSKVFFSDDAAAGLTPDTVPGSGTNLYEYDLLTGALSDLTAATEAEVEGLSGIGPAESTGEVDEEPYVYFVAKGVFGVGPHGEQPQQGQPNLYAVHSGVTQLVATLASSDFCDWTPQCLSARTSASGAFLAFSSTNSLTGYHNQDAISNLADSEVYLYGANDRELGCASCNPTGAPPTAPATIRTPAPPSTSGEMRNAYPQRNVSDSGQVFFETADSLQPADVNSQTDLYEYQNREVRLISGGTSQAGSYFLDASASGGDVFFETAQPLLSSDVDSTYDIYDARAGGGFAQPPSSAAPCDSEACRATPAIAPPTFSIPLSESFSAADTLDPSSVGRSHRLAHRRHGAAHKRHRVRRKTKRRHAHGSLRRGSRSPGGRGK
jgi:hypothetical protein